MHLSLNIPYNMYVDAKCLECRLDILISRRYHKLVRPRVILFLESYIITWSRLEGQKFVVAAITTKFYYTQHVLTGRSRSDRPSVSGCI